MTNERANSIKQLKVDNWGDFFLQRLQPKFAKGELCDLTLKFFDGAELKVHRLVLNTCTQYFETLPVNDNVIFLPKSLKFKSTKPIIHFMYSGKLEFTPDLQIELLNTAKILNMSILMKLLNAQHCKIKYEPKIPVGRKIEHRKTKNQNYIGRTTSGNQFQTFGGNMLDVKKLPIWKRRPYAYQNSYKRSSDEEPKPTRSEFNEDEAINLLAVSPLFSAITYDNIGVDVKPKINDSESSSNNLITTSPTSYLKESVKRRVMPPLTPVSSKKQKSDEPHSDEDDDDQFENEGFSEEENITETSNEINTSKPPSRPILKASSIFSNNTPNNKTVRFSFDSEVGRSITKDEANNKLKKNNENSKENSIENLEDDTNKDGVIHADHSKIIAEVLKKYPHLVKNNQNIKLKITTPNCTTPKTLTINTEVKNAIAGTSYVVVKTPKTDQKKFSVSGLKQTGCTPWKCRYCELKNHPIYFDCYDTYKKHIQDYHPEENLNEENLCQICGFKTIRKNFFHYHMYLKHQIKPPKNMKFPHCTHCDFIALSTSSLFKHIDTHGPQEKNCPTCNLKFRSAVSFHAHSVVCKPKHENFLYKCKECHKQFKTTVSMNAHTEECLGCLIDEKDHDQQETSLNQILENRLDENNMNQEGTLIQSENLNLSSNIGTLMNLPTDQTVILLDENTEIFLQDENGSVMMANDGDVQEYVVSDELGRLYTTDGIPYTVSDGTNLITYPISEVNEHSQILIHAESDKQILSNNISNEQNQSEFLQVSTSIKDDSISESGPQEVATPKLTPDSFANNSDDNTHIDLQENEAINEVIVNQENQMLLDNGRQPQVINNLSDSKIFDTQKSEKIEMETDTLTMENNEMNFEEKNKNFLENINGSNITNGNADTGTTNDNFSKTVNKNKGDNILAKNQSKIGTVVKHLTNDWDLEAEDSLEIIDPDVRPSRPDLE